ncbi:MAG: hypothetical protein ROZ64_07050 [Burkholderiaceae bacterium]|jgi:ElaB/YqjD/DUF883 family membrane-anchored ribosome-binding protein|nr:hypothetical protein [Burkholderiaceae bacterium]
MQTGTQTTGGSTSSHSAGSFPTADEMKRQAEQGADRIADKAHETVERLSQKVQPTMDALTEKASQAVDAVSQRADQLRGSGEAALETTRNYVRENPIAAIGIAAVAGLLLGRMRH